MMRKAIVLIALSTILFNMIPLSAYAETTDECDRVESLIDNVQAMIDRSGPIILRSGNRLAISMLNEAVNHLRAARRAYNNDLCRTALNHARTAANLIRRAMRLVNRPEMY
jgi:hypothetical protein